MKVSISARIYTKQRAIEIAADRKREERGTRKERYIEARHDSAERTGKRGAYGVYRMQGER
jgi:hypothetical protein